MSAVTMRSGETRTSGYAAHPGYRVWLEPAAKQVRVMFNDVAVADSGAVQVLHETRHRPVYYFPRDAVEWRYFTPTEHSTFCPFKGEAHYWSLTVGERTEPNVLWGYPQPFGETEQLADYVAFYWAKMDQWLERELSPG